MTASLLLDPTAIEATQRNRAFLGEGQIALLSYNDHDRIGFSTFITFMF